MQTAQQAYIESPTRNVNDDKTHGALLLMLVLSNPLRSESLPSKIGGNPSKIGGNP
jgi:hypothetical protein